MTAKSACKKDDHLKAISVPRLLLIITNGYSKYGDGTKAKTNPRIHVIPVTAVSFSTIRGRFVWLEAAILPCQGKSTNQHLKANKKTCGIKDVPYKLTLICEPLELNLLEK